MRGQGGDEFLDEKVVLEESESEAMHVHDRSGSGVETGFLWGPAGRNADEVFNLPFFVLMSVRTGCMHVMTHHTHAVIWVDNVLKERVDQPRQSVQYQGSPSRLIVSWTMQRIEDTYIDGIQRQSNDLDIRVEPFLKRSARSCL
jgi:hypothetical protein